MVINLCFNKPFNGACCSCVCVCVYLSCIKTALYLVFLPVSLFTNEPYDGINMNWNFINSWSKRTRNRNELFDLNIWICVAHLLILKRFYGNLSNGQHVCIFVGQMNGCILVLLFCYFWLLDFDSLQIKVYTLHSLLLLLLLWVGFSLSLSVFRCDLHKHTHIAYSFFGGIISL